jgi:hypothetical protein
MKKKIFGLDFEQSVDYVESVEGQEYSYELASKHIAIAYADGVFVVYDSAGAQLVFGDGKLLTRED